MAKKRRSSRRRRGSRSARGEAVEWVGGVLSPSFYISDEEEPYRPDVAVWIDKPSGLVVAQDVLAPEESEGGLSRALLAALERAPTEGWRRPGRLRVADDSLAAEVRADMGDAIPVVVAPTPELEELREFLEEAAAAEAALQESYLAGGRLEPEAVKKLFVAAEILYTTAPWKRVTDDRILRMDIPALDLDGACVSIIGRLGESLGFLVFPSLEGYVGFLNAAQEPPAEGAPLDLGSEWLSLSFESGADLPRPMRREAAAHAWPVANAAAYPWVAHNDADGAPRPLTPRDVEIVAACAEALSAFFVRHGGLVEADDPEPVCESYFQDDGREVRLTLPYEAFPFFDVQSEPVLDVEPRRSLPKVGRNDPCPCGSGRKYKKCHLPLQTKERSVEHRRDRERERESRLVDDLMGFAAERFGDAWRRFTEDFDEVTKALELAIPWSIYHFRVEGESVLEHYLEKKGRRLSKQARARLEAQRAAWLSVWEVTQVEAGKSLTLRDLLSDQERSFPEKTASKTLVLRDAILARVVERDEGAILDGVYPYSLPPLLAAEVVRRARGRLRRKRAVPVERLQDEGFGRYLIRRWEEAVQELEETPAFPQRLENTDGDPLLFTSDHFEVEPGQGAELAARLAALEDVECPEEGDDEPTYVFLRAGNPTQKSWEKTVVGLARLSSSTLELETNSRRRADDLRARVEAVCGDLIRHRAREHADPLSEKALLADIGKPRPESAPEPPPEEQARMALELKQQHYADWLDQEIPALDGDTPREAARTRQGRIVLDLLLKDMEHREQHTKDGAIFDFAAIRRELGVD